MTNKECRQLLSEKPAIVIDESHISQTIILAKNEAQSREPYKRIGFCTFCLRQVGLFGWKIWLMQAAVCLFLCGAIYAEHLQVIGVLAYSIPFGLRVSAVITVLTMLPTLYRSIRYGMLEVEISAQTGYSRLLLSRLTLMGIGDVLILAGILAFAVLKMNVGLVNALFCLLPPFLIMLSALMLLLPRVPLRTLPYALIAIGISMFIGIAALGAKSFQPSANPTLCAICALALVLCITQCIKLRRQCGFADVQFS